jgi:hypothetical protein
VAKKIPQRVRTILKETRKELLLSARPISLKIKTTGALFGLELFDPRCGKIFPFVLA